MTQSNNGGGNNFAAPATAGDSGAGAITPTTSRFDFSQVQGFESIYGPNSTSTSGDSVTGTNNGGNGGLNPPGEAGSNPQAVFDNLDTSGLYAGCCGDGTGMTPGQPGTPGPEAGGPPTDTTSGTTAPGVDGTLCDQAPQPGAPPRSDVVAAGDQLPQTDAPNVPNAPARRDAPPVNSLARQGGG